MVRLQSYSPVAYNTYFVRNYNGEDLFVHALHDTVPEITKKIYRNGDKVRVPDEEAIQEAATKIQVLVRYADMYCYISVIDNPLYDRE